MTEIKSLPEEAGLLHIGEESIQLYKFESEEGAVYVSGMQGLICTMYMVEEATGTPGESNLKPVCLSVDLATPTDSSMPKVTLKS